MNTTRLTTKGKILIAVLIVLFAGIAVYFTSGMNISVPSVSLPSGVGGSASSGSSYSGGDTMNISLDEWIGWKPILDANGGLETKPGSIYDKLGLKVKINVINDATQSSNALIKGDLAAAGYTINRYAFLYPKFAEAQVPVVMPYITNYSTGGDGIIAKDGINSVEQLVGKKIAVPRYSEAQTLVVWLLQQSSLSDAQKKQVFKDIVYTETPDDAAKAFFAGQVDAAATWQPYLTQAAQGTGSKILFSTKNAHNIILDGVVFRQDYMESNQDKVAKFIEGALKAKDQYTVDMESIRGFPLFATETPENIKAIAADATLADYADNKKLLDGTAQILFTDMSNVWKQLGEKVMPEAVSQAFSSAAIDTLSSQFSSIQVAQKQFTPEMRATAQAKSDALMTKTCTIEFKPNTAIFIDSAAAAKILDEFANASKVLDGTVIQVEGNIADPKNTGKTSAGGQQLSYARAKAVADYMIRVQGVDPNRFVIVGNGVSKPVASNATSEGQQKNRRTDVFFKTVE